MLPLHRIGSFRTRTLSLSLLGALALGCGGQPKAESPEPAAPEAPQAPPKQDLSKLFAREADPIGEQQLKLGEGILAARIEAKSPPQVASQDNIVTVDADLGWDGPVKCFIYPEEIDAAGTVAQLLGRLTKAAKVLKVEPYAIENAGADPIVFVRTVYEMPNANGQKAIGDLKIMVTPRDPGAVMCMLDAPGYAASFQRVASNFARSFEPAQKPEPAKREELWVTKLGDLPMGFTRTRLVSGGEKSAFLWLTTSARLLPSSETELSTNDSVAVTFLDKQGSIVEGTWAEFDAGAETLRAKLTKTKKGYDYEGQLQDKAIQGSFSTKQPITDDYATNKRFTALARAGKPASFESTSYLPSIDPAAGSIASFKLEPSEGGFAIEGKLGNVTAFFSADAQGTLRSYRIPMGGREVTSKLVFEQGSL